MQVDSTGDIINISNGGGSGSFSLTQGTNIALSPNPWTGGSATISASGSTAPGVYNIMNYIDPAIVTAMLTPSGSLTDVGGAINTAITSLLAGSQTGITLYFPAATYNCGSTIVIDMSGGGKVLNLIGDGAGNTVIRSKVSSGGTGLSVTGPAYNANNEQWTMSGFTLTGNGIGSNQTALHFVSLQFMALESVTIQNFATVGTIQDIVGGTWTRVVQFNNANGITFSQATQSPVNELVFIECHVEGNTQFGYNFIQSANIQFIGGSLEFMGTNGSPALYGIQAGNVLNGSYSLNILGLHCETSCMPAFIILNGSTFQPMLCNVDGCDFYQNPGGVDGGFVTNMVSVVNPGSGTSFTVNVTKCAFGGFGYTPNASRAVVLTTGSDITLNLSGNNYANSVEIPNSGVLFSQDGIISATTATTTISNSLQVNSNLFCGNIQSFAGRVVLNTGVQLAVQSGANALAGVATLTSGSVVVATTATPGTSNGFILLTAQDSSGSTTPPYVSAVTPGVNFTIASTGGGSGKVAWLIIYTV
jgi:hypothetical protein